MNNYKKDTQPDVLKETHPINNDFYSELGDRWYSAYDDPVALLRAENKVKLPWIHSQIIQSLGLNRSLKILDVGCGAGFATNYLANHFENVVGIDLAQGALATAQQFGNNNVKYILGDARELPFEDEKFDVVISLDFLEHVTAPELIIAQIAKVLKPGGLFFYHTFSKNWLAYLVVIKGVEWFVKNTPEHMHSYDLFINHREIKKWCELNQMSFKGVTGIRPEINRYLFQMMWNRVVPENLEFTTTRSLLISYLGFSQKNI